MKKAAEDNDEDESSSVRGMLLCFWGRRLVPHDMVRRLPFYPKTEENAMLLERCRGVLMFPTEMKISRNKMNLLLADKKGLEGALNSDKHTTWDRKHTHKSDRQSGVLPFLKYCHERYDKEVIFTGVENKIDAESGGIIAKSAEYINPRLMFTSYRKATFAGKDVFEVGSRVRHKSTYGVIEEILVAGLQREGYKGLGWVRIKRFPVEIHKENHPNQLAYRKAHTFPIVALKQGNSGLASAEDWKREMSKQHETLPGALKVYHTFPKPGAVEHELGNGRRQIVDCTVKQTDTFSGLDFSIKVLDGKGKQITKTKKGPVTVAMVILAEESPDLSSEQLLAMQTQFGTHLEEDDPERGYRVTNNQSISNLYCFPAGEKEETSQSFWSDLLCFPGKYKIVFECEGAESRMVQTEPKVVHVKVGNPNSVHLMEECKGWNQKKTQGKLGQVLADSPMSFYFNDLAGSILTLSKQGAPKVTAAIIDSDDVFQVACDTAINESDPQVLDITNIKIEAIERDNTEGVLGTSTPRRKKVKLQIRFDFKKLNVQMHSPEFAVTLFPGAPESCKIEGDLIEDAEIDLENGSILQEFSVQLVDAAGIDTFGKRETVTVTLQVDTEKYRGLQLFEPGSRVEEVADSTGAAHFRGIKIQANKFNTPIEVNIKFSGDMGVAEDMFRVVVRPCTAPAKMEVWQRIEDGGRSDQRTLMRKFSATAKTSLEGLFVRLFDHAGKEIDLGTLPDRTAFTPMWKKTVVTTKPYKLPPLMVSGAIGEYNQQLKLSIPKTDRRAAIKLDAEFTVRALAGDATEWVFEWPKKRSKKITCGEKGSLQSLAVFPADANGFATKCSATPLLCVGEAQLAAGSSGDLPPPKFILLDGTSTDKVKLLCKTVRDDEGAEHNAFILPQGVTVGGPAGRVKFMVENGPTNRGAASSAGEAAGLTPPEDPFEIELQAGEVKSIRLESTVVPFKESSTEFDEKERMWTYTCHTQRKFMWSDLTVRAFDQWDNFAKRYTGPASVTASGGCEINRNIKVRFKQGVAKLPNLDLEAVPGNVKYELVVETERKVRATINCVVMLANSVIELEESGRSFKRLFAGDDFGAVEYVLKTEDGAAIAPADSFSGDNFKFTLAKGKQEILVDAVVSVTNEERSIGRGSPAVAVVQAQVRFTRRDGGAALKLDAAGKYKLICKYTDPRENLASKHKLEMEIEVLPGAADEIVLSTRQGRIRASNGPALPQRLLLKNPILEAIDRFGNKTGLDASVAVELRCAEPPDHPGHISPPTLDGATDGRVEASPDRSRAVPQVRFKQSLYLEEGVGAAEGVFTLRFFAPSKPNVRAAEVPVEFSTDAKRTEELQQLTEQLQKVEERLDALKEAEDAADSNQEVELEKARGLTRRIKRNHRRLAEIDAVDVAISGEDIIPEAQAETVYTEYNRRKNDLERQRAARPAVVDPASNPAIARNYGFKVVEQGFVSDPAVARILSFAVKGRLGSTVCPNAQKQREAYEQHNLSCFAEDGMLPFIFTPDPAPGGEPSGPNRRRRRNEAELQEGRLPEKGPLKFLSEQLPRGIKAPRLMVNMLELPPEKEKYRDTVFWTLFKTSLMMDTLEDAQAYRQHKTKQHQNCPTIFTKDGHTLANDGFLHAGSRLTERTRLPNVFGAMPVQQTTQYKLVSEIEADAEELYDAHSEIKAKTNDYDSAHEEAATHRPALEVERTKIKEAIRKLKRLQPSGYVPPAKRSRT
eukprot:SAG22_NODE_766_length_7392_cov_4.700123_2_plen_1726_part_00